SIGLESGLGCGVRRRRWGRGAAGRGGAPALLEGFAEFFALFGGEVFPTITPVPAPAAGTMATAQTAKENAAERKQADSLPEGKYVPAEKRRQEPIPKEHYHPAAECDEGRQCGRAEDNGENHFLFAVHHVVSPSLTWLIAGLTAESLLTYFFFPK